MLQGGCSGVKREQYLHDCAKTFLKNTLVNPLVHIKTVILNETGSHILLSQCNFYKCLCFSVYRYIAYRRFTRWMYGLLGRKQRKVIPSCAVMAIRDRFPSEEYCGFKYPQKKTVLRTFQMGSTQ